ncbi:hypothetical protein OJ253_405 [Cryptosporidium canis]|uniref:BRCT domain-containing protein n=1 Tax=Cryptosporidium canis TaxID=195482 RepID=A0A9D5DQ24_9CRYT|nr:hypothetical protein OJ253_405 [Cryptosporidium canis]
MTEYFGVPRRECEIPGEFVGIGLNAGERTPFEMKKLTGLKNPANSNQIDQLLGDIGEPTYREIPVGEEGVRESIREAFSQSVAEPGGRGEGHPDGSKGCGSGRPYRILEWFRDRRPIWDEDDYFVKSELFRSTPDWRKLETYKDLISCEWGSARVLLMIQFWQASLTFTDRLVNNRDSSIVEYVGGNEESCLPLRILVKFERKVSRQTAGSGGGQRVSRQEPESRRALEPVRESCPALQREGGEMPFLSSSRLEDESDSPAEDSELEARVKEEFDIRYLDMVKYIPGKDKSAEFRSLEGRFRDSGESGCYLYMDSPRDFFLKLQIKYDREIIGMIKACIRGRRYDNESRLWLLPTEAIYESVCMVEFLGGVIDRAVLSLLVNGSKTGLSHRRLVPQGELENWRALLPKSSRGTWYRTRIRFHLGDVSRGPRDSSFKLTFCKESLDEHYKNELIKRFRSSNISVRWDSGENCWRLPLDQFQSVINTCRGGLEFSFSSASDQIVFEEILERMRDPSFQGRVLRTAESEIRGREGKKGVPSDSRRSKRARLFDSDEETGGRFGGLEDEGNQSTSFGESNQALILSCLGKDDHDSKRLETRITSMIKKIKRPRHIDKIEFLLWPRHYKDWESISFLIISKDFDANRYHPKLLLSIVSNVMIVSEEMIDYIVQKNTWPDNSFETKFEQLNGLPSLESRLYVNEGIFCKTKLFIVGSPGNNHFKLCTRLATLGNASFVQDPLLADYIIICDEKDPNALKIKRSVPKKQASKVQNTHGETHSIQVTPKWVYDVVLDFTIIKPTSKRNHKAWING